MRSVQLFGTVAAGALGAAVAALLVGASLVVVVPAALGVGLVGVASERTRRD